jgi:hypothetical protein
MKKLLLIFVLFITTLMYSQNNPFYMRAESFKAGKKDYKGTVIWDDSSQKNCDILIRLDDQQATVYSQTQQIYRVISMTTKNNQGSIWYCVDAKGNYCNLCLINLTSMPGKLAFAIEYNDYSWFYVCKPSN